MPAAHWSNERVRGYNHAVRAMRGKRRRAPRVEIRLPGFKTPLAGLCPDQIEEFYAAINKIREKRITQTPQSFERIQQAQTRSLIDTMRLGRACVNPWKPHRAVTR
jgi:hypothetical protein